MAAPFEKPCEKIFLHTHQERIFGMATYSVTAKAGLYVRQTPDSSSKTNILGKAAFEAVVKGIEQNADASWLRGTTTTDQGEQTGWMSLKWLKQIETRSDDERKDDKREEKKPLSLAWRLGVNMREFAYYGTPFLPPSADAGLRARQLSLARELGIKVIRIWASHHRFNTHDSIHQLEMALSVIDEFKMQAVVCLDDSLTGAGLYIPGDDAFHTATHGHLIKGYFNQERYRLNYLPHVRQIVTAFKDSRAILMWELGNEYALHPRPPVPGAGEPDAKDAAAFRRFAEVASKTIKEIAPDHLVGTGLVHANHVASPFENRRESAQQLYSIPTIDAVSLHYYAHVPEYEQMAIDIEVAKTLGKPIYVGEVGMEVNTGDRAAYLNEQIKTKRQEGAFMVMPWNLDNAEWDANIGDIYAFSRRHGDFGAVLDAIKAHAK
jgi:hypothetical protein